MIGIGPSGVDLAMMLSNVAKRTTLSRKKPQNQIDELRKKFETSLSNVIFKDEIKRLTEDGAEFMDGSRQSFSTIIYATGEYFCSFCLPRVELSSIFSNF